MHRSFGQLADWEGARLPDILTEESRRKFDRGWPTRDGAPRWRSN